jgi:predicted dehydrogenase
MNQDIFQRRLRAGIVGGGPGSLIGAVHRVAAELDGQAQVVAGAMSADPHKAREAAAAWFLPRSYESYTHMAQAEAAHPDPIDFVIIATPNHLHFPVAKAFLERGFHVVCDKPMTFTLNEAHELARLVESTQAVFALTHTYTGYPLVRQARELVRQGVIGEVRKVLVDYVQDWLMEPLEQSGNKQAAWRTDPARSGIAGAVGDIGTHAENLLEYITGLRIRALCADLTTFVAGRLLDDDANILLRLSNGGKGVLTCSQIAAGEENRLGIRVYGSKAGLEWQQQEPHQLLLKQPGQPQQVWRTGQPYLSEAAKNAARLPAGHPEGFYEAFATIYRDAMADIRRVKTGQKPLGGYPSVSDGVRGMVFIAKVVQSSQQGAVWVEMDDE